MEPELRAAAPLLFGSSFTTQAADHLGQVEALRKVKGKNKRAFQAPLTKAGLVAGGEQALSARIWREDVSCNSQEAAEMTINYTRAEGSVICMYRAKCINDCQSYIAKTACVGLHSGTKTCDQSSGGGKNFSVCHQLEGDNAGSVDPSYGSRLSHPFQGRTSPNASSSTLSLLEGADNTITRGGSFSAGERCGGGSGPHLISGGFTQPSF